MYNLIMKINDKNNLRNLTTDTLNERKVQILSTQLPIEDIIHGSLITRSIKCGKPNCHCADGKGHKSFYLSSFYHGNTYMDYVPKKWEDWMRSGIKNYEVIQDILIELAEINLELFRRRQRE